MDCRNGRQERARQGRKRRRAKNMMGNEYDEQDRICEKKRGVMNDLLVLFYFHRLKNSKRGDEARTNWTSTYECGFAPTGDMYECELHL